MIPQKECLGDNALTKKIAIVTIVTVNFGNRLQNYALQNVLEKMKYSVYTLRRCEEKKEVTEYLKTIAQTALRTKGSKFKRFNSNIHFAEDVVTRDEFPKDLADRYDYFISGSDQVWNPYYDFVAGECDFLAFARDEQKISYAASFGVSTLPVERKNEVAKKIKQFKAVSVREKQGAKIVGDLTGKSAVVVLDPTLLLDENDWQKVEKKSFCQPKRKYVFVYCLGEISIRLRKKIEELSKIYEIFDVRKIQKNGKELPVGPAEFLSLLRNAEIILTDSFHATVFSVIYHKRFVTFNRSGLNMNSRIESLAELIGEKKRINQYGDLDCEAEIDYNNVDAAIEKEREKSLAFLEKALGD